MTGRDLARLAAGLLIGAAIALPVGMRLGADDDDRATPARHSPRGAERRAVFSPKVLSDPYFLEEQRAGVAALEAHCRKSGELRAEARAARERLAELE